ncbi:unnamed protein product [Sympodiomycopsis kandeliae]
MASNSRQRSQRKASNLANVAIASQSREGLLPSRSSGSGLTQAHNRALTVRERQQLEEEAEERQEKERANKRRKIQRRLDELERTNPKDPLGSSSTSGSSSHSVTNRNDGESFSIPNSALAAAVSRISKSQASSSAPSRSTGHDDDSRDNRSSSPTHALQLPSNTQPRKSSSTQTGGTTASHPTIRRLILYRRGYNSLLESAASSDIFSKADINFLSASSAAEKARLIQRGKIDSQRIRVEGSRRRNKKSDFARGYEPSSLTLSQRPLFCTICGQDGQAFCPRCSDRTCVKTRCLETHNDISSVP